ncbi:MAG: hypothetical protein JRN20_04850 [Nitrososphaerota archaeon]|nr:hypothetical protein [Nitrososphaerota archaeon]
MVQKFFDMPSKEKIISQLENRKHNLAVLQEVTKNDASSAEILAPVRDFLSSRIRTLEHELAV